MSSQPESRPDATAAEPPAADPGARGDQTGLNVCPACAGTGAGSEGSCPTCGGTGTVEEPVGDA